MYNVARGLVALAQEILPYKGEEKTLEKHGNFFKSNLVVLLGF